MSKDPEVNLTDDRLFYLHTSIIYKCVCAPKSWTGERVSEEATRVDPPGTSANRWVVADRSDSDEKDDPWKNGNPTQCADDPGRRHWLLNC